MSRRSIGRAISAGLIKIEQVPPYHASIDLGRVPLNRAQRRRILREARRDYSKALRGAQ